MAGSAGADASVGIGGAAGTGGTGGKAGTAGGAHGGNGGTTWGAGGTIAAGAGGIATGRDDGGTADAGPVYSCVELDDAMTQLGAAERLVNLGYLDRVVSGSEYAAALKQFQTDNGLTADGILGPQTANTLVLINGC